MHSVSPRLLEIGMKRWKRASLRIVHGVSTSANVSSAQPGWRNTDRQLLLDNQTATARPSTTGKKKGRINTQHPSATPNHNNRRRVIGVVQSWSTRIATHTSALKMKAVSTENVPTPAMSPGNRAVIDAAIKPTRWLKT